MVGAVPDDQPINQWRGDGGAEVVDTTAQCHDLVDTFNMESMRGILSEDALPTGSESYMLSSWESYSTYMASA